MQPKGKKENLRWEISKLQAKAGEATSKRAQKAVKAVKTDKSDKDTNTTELSAEELEKLQKLKETKISQKIYHAKKEIKKAFSKAKTFETQRLVKRLKEAKKDVESQDSASTTDDKEELATTISKRPKLTADDIAKFEKEMGLVKDMDMEVLSESAFIAKLNKHPILGSHPLMTIYIAAPQSKATDEAKDPLIQIIEARLTNTKTVKDLLVRLWNELEFIATGKRFEGASGKRKAGDEADDKQNKKQKQEQTDTNSESDDEGGNDSSDDIDLSGNENSDGYDSDGLPLPMNGGGARPAGKASTVSSMFIGSLNEGNGKKDKKDKKRSKDNWVDDKFDEIYGKVKKNRPGQAARRAKAERKFGNEANHVKKAAEEAKKKEERKAARQAKKDKFNARDASSANSQRLPNKRIIGAGDGSTSQKAPRPVFTPPAKDFNDPTLHPSWIAKNAEKNAVAAALAAGKGSKIVFDDSD